MKRAVLAASVVVVALVALRFGVAGIERWMRQDPHRMPPAWQVRLQTSQLAQSMVADADIGILLPSNLAKQVVTEDFTFTRRSDAHGFSNVGTWPEHPAYVFLGDSLLLGEGVGVEYGFVARIATMLTGASALNLGNPGAGVARQMRIYRRFAASLRPHLVIACLYLAADLDNDRHFRAWVTDPQGMDYDSFRLSYRRRVEPPTRTEFSKRVERHPLLGWLQSFVEPLLWGERWMPHRVEMPKGEYFLERSKIEFARRPAAAVAGDLEALFSSLDELRTMVEADARSRLVVMLIPSKEEIFAVPPPADGVVAAVRARLSASRIPYLDLYPILRAREAEAATYFPRDIHLSRFGNEVVAKAFVDWQRSAPLGDR